MYSYIRDANNTLSLSINGVKVDSVKNHTSNYDSNGKLTIGPNGNIDLGEFVIYDVDMTASQLKAVEKYFMDRWGL